MYLDKNKSIFSKPKKIWQVQLKKGIRVSSVKAYSNWLSQTLDHGYKLVKNYKLICSLITFSWNTFNDRSNFHSSLKLLCSRFKFQNKSPLHTLHLSLAICRGKWLLRIIPSVRLFTNVNRVNQQHKLTPCCLYKAEDSGAPLIPISLEFMNRFKAKSKTQHLH